MPDLLQFFQAFIVAAIGGSSMSALGQHIVPRRMRVVIPSVAWFCGVVAGCGVIGFPLTWPPANGLQRFGLISLPAALLVECALLLSNSPQRVVWTARALGAILLPRVILHDSVYLVGAPAQWSAWEVVAICGALGLGLLWTQAVTSRAGDPFTLWSRSMMIACSTAASGVVILLGGYLRGGATAVPCVGSLLGVLLVAPNRSARLHDVSLKCLSLVSLWGLLMVGYFYGEIIAWQALTLALAPAVAGILDLLCPSKWRGKRWQVVRTLVVIAMILYVVLCAKQAFDASLGRLL